MSCAANLELAPDLVQDLPSPKVELRSLWKPEGTIAAVASWMGGEMSEIHILVFIILSILCENTYFLEYGTTHTMMEK